MYTKGFKQEFSSSLCYLIKPKEADPFHLNHTTSMSEQRLNACLDNPDDIEKTTTFVTFKYGQNQREKSKLKAIPTPQKSV